MLTNEEAFELTALSTTLAMAKTNQGKHFNSKYSDQEFHAASDEANEAHENFLEYVRSITA